MTTGAKRVNELYNCTNLLQHITCKFIVDLSYPNLVQIQNMKQYFLVIHLIVLFAFIKHFIHIRSLSPFPLEIRNDLQIPASIILYFSIKKKKVLIFHSTLQHSILKTWTNNGWQLTIGRNWNICTIIVSACRRKSVAIIDKQVQLEYYIYCPT